MQNSTSTLQTLVAATFALGLWAAPAGAIPFFSIDFRTETGTPLPDPISGCCSVRCARSEATCRCGSFSSACLAPCDVSSRA